MCEIFALERLLHVGLVEKKSKSF